MHYLKPPQTLRVPRELALILQMRKLRLWNDLFKVTGLGSNPDLLNPKGHVLFTLQSKPCAVVRMTVLWTVTMPHERIWEDNLHPNSASSTEVQH